MPGVIDYDELDEAARLRMGGQSPSRTACWVCGLSEDATIHGADVWWQHSYQLAILTKART